MVLAQPVLDLDFEFQNCLEQISRFFFGYRACRIVLTDISLSAAVVEVVPD